MNLPTWMNEHHSEGFAVTDEGEEALTFTRAEFDAWVEEHDARMRTRGLSDAETIQRLRDQIEEARHAWWSAIQQGDGHLIYTDKIEDAMDDIWSAIGHADWVPENGDKELW